MLASTRNNAMTPSRNEIKIRFRRDDYHGTIHTDPDVTGIRARTTEPAKMTSAIPLAQLEASRHKAAT